MKKPSSSSEADFFFLREAVKNLFVKDTISSSSSKTQTSETEEIKRELENIQKDNELILKDLPPFTNLIL